MSDDDQFASIWNQIQNASPLNEMLKDANTTFIQVMNEETLLQEIKTGNQMVIDYFVKPETVEKVLEILTDKNPLPEKPSDEKIEKDENELVEYEYMMNNQKYKYPFLISEIVTIAKEDINKQLVTKNALTKIFKFLGERSSEKIEERNPAMFGYVVKILLELLNNYYFEITNFVMSKTTTNEEEGEEKEDEEEKMEDEEKVEEEGDEGLRAVFKEIDTKENNLLKVFLLRHLNMYEMNKLIVCLLGYKLPTFESDLGMGMGRIGDHFNSREKENSDDIQKQRAAMKAWAMKHDLLNETMNFIKAKPEEEDVQRPVFEMLSMFLKPDHGKLDDPESSEILQEEGNAIQKELFSINVAENLINLILDNPNTPLFTHGLDFIQELVYNIHCETNDYVDDREKIPDLLTKIATFTPQFIKLLGSDGESPTAFSIPSQRLSPPLGRSRLAIIEHIRMFFKMNFLPLHTDIGNAGFFNHLVDLFFTYTNHNILHTNAYTIISQTIESRNFVLIRQLLAEAKLVEKIIVTANKIYEETNAMMKNSKVLSEQRPLIFNAHMGHIVAISNLIQPLCQTCLENVTEGDDDLLKLRALTLENEAWLTFVKKILSKKNRINNSQLSAENSYFADGYDDHSSEDDFDSDESDEDRPQPVVETLREENDVVMTSSPSKEEEVTQVSSDPTDGWDLDQQEIVAPPAQDDQDDISESGKAALQELGLESDVSPIPQANDAFEDVEDFDAEW